MDTETYTIWTKSGQPVAVRHLRPGEAAILVEIFEHMGSESRYRRFHQTLDNVKMKQVWDEAEKIAEANPRDNNCLIAFIDDPAEDERPIAAARYVGLNAFEAETAISVADAWQRQGLGTQLMRLLAEEAREAGFRRLVATIQNENEGIWRVFDRLPYQVTRTPEGTYASIAIELTVRRTQERAAGAVRSGR